MHHHNPACHVGGRDAPKGEEPHRSEIERLLAFVTSHPRLLGKDRLAGFAFARFGFVEFALRNTHPEVRGTSASGLAQRMNEPAMRTVDRRWNEWMDVAGTRVFRQRGSSGPLVGVGADAVLDVQQLPSIY